MNVIDGGYVARLRGQETDLRLALLARKRATIIALRDQRRIDDIVLRRLQHPVAFDLRVRGWQPNQMSTNIHH